MQLASRKHVARDEAEAARLARLEGWTDGLPIVVPTPERVTRMLDAAGPDPDPSRVVATIREQAVTVTLEQVAVNAVMAGCEPASFPVVVAAIIAIGDESFNLHSTTVSGATAPLVIIGGNAVHAYDINDSCSLFGPGPTADTAIGRAVRLVLLNACSGVPGTVDKSTFGHPGKLSFCIGEAARHLPAGWEPLHRTQGSATESGLTAVSCDAPIAVRNDWSSDAREILRAIADVMSGHHTGGCYVVVLGPRHAAAVTAAGWSRSEVASYLHEQSARDAGELVKRGRIHPSQATAAVDGLLHAVEDPDDILLTVAGGELYGYSAVLPPWVGGRETRPVTVDLPARGGATDHPTPHPRNGKEQA